MKRPLVYDYVDYRVFLSDLYNYMKSSKKCFSFRYFAHKAGFASPNYLKLVIDNMRNLTHLSIPKVAKGFDLKRSEAAFFEILVCMNQASTHKEKDHYYNKIISMRHRKDGHFLEKEKYEYFSKWYYPVIREIITFDSHELSPDQISISLNPVVAVNEVENALNLLQKLDLIKKDKKGRWQQTNTTITTGPEVRSVIATNFHKEMIKLAVDSIDHCPAELRDISALILSVRKDTIPRLKEMLAAFRQDLMDLAAAEKDPEMVVEINTQLFPTSK